MKNKKTTYFCHCLSLSQTTVGVKGKGEKERKQTSPTKPSFKTFRGKARFSPPELTQTQIPKVDGNGA